MAKHLYLIRGLPGSGKSTFAKTLAEALNFAHYEADQYFYNSHGEYNFDPRKLHMAHLWCRTMTTDRMMDGEGIVVSNTFTTEQELKPYLTLAALYDYQVTCLIVENRHGHPSIHNVPQETLDKMEARFSVKF